MLRIFERGTSWRTAWSRLRIGPDPHPKKKVRWRAVRLRRLTTAWWAITDDGVIVGGPGGLAYPALGGECKCLGNKPWRELRRTGFAVAKPVYAAQVAIYQAYLELHEHLAIFTARTPTRWRSTPELVPLDAALPNACRIGR